jgi:hypothetical protein
LRAPAGFHCADVVHFTTSRESASNAASNACPEPSTSFAENAMVAVVDDKKQYQRIRGRALTWLKLSPNSHSISA